MKPENHKGNGEFERVSTDDFISGKIADVQYDPNHKFSYQGQESTASAVRFAFEFEGYKFKHYSRWMKFNYGEKSNVFTKYLLPLVKNASPDMDFDLDALKGAKVKVLWAEKNYGDGKVFQYPETIRPIGEKIDPNKPIEEVEENGNGDDETPF